MNTFLTSLFIAPSSLEGAQVFSLWGNTAVLPPEDMNRISAAMEKASPEMASAFQTNEDPKARAAVLARLTEGEWRRFRIGLEHGRVHGLVAARNIGMVMEQEYLAASENLATEVLQILDSLLVALKDPELKAVPSLQHGSMRNTLRLLGRMRFDNDVEGMIRQILEKDEALRLILDAMDPEKPVSNRAAELGETLLQLHVLKRSSPELVAELVAEVSILTPEAVRAYLSSRQESAGEPPAEEAFTTALK